MVGNVTINEARLDVWHQNTPSSDAPDRTIDGTELQSISIDTRAQDVLDEGAIDVNLSRTSGTDLLRVGDRVRFVASLYTGQENEPWGEGRWGEGRWGGGLIPIRWTGRIVPLSTKREYSRPGIIAADASDYVGDILANRQITNAYVEEDAGAIIRDICENKATEIDASEVPDLGVTTDQFFRSKNCWDAIVGLAALGDCLIRQEGRNLLIDPIGELTYRFDLEPSDYVMPWETKVDDDVKNVIRVDAGTNRKEERAQEQQDVWTRVTESSRLTYRLRARKSQIHSLELYTRNVSEDDITIRLQADEDGAPVAIVDEDSDIESARRKSDNITGEGWTTFFIPDHTLPDRDPWLIVQSSGEDGQDIGLSASGTPTYRTFYPHPLNFEASDTDSIGEFGSRELRISRQNLDTLSAARDAVYAELARRAWPSKTITFTARSPRAHSLSPGTRITVDRPDENAVGEFVVVEAARTFDAEAVRLETQITAKWRKGILAPQT